MPMKESGKENFMGKKKGTYLLLRGEKISSRTRRQVMGGVHFWKSGQQKLFLLKEGYAGL